MLQELDHPFLLLEDNNSLFYEFVAKSGPNTSAYFRALAKEVFEKQSSLEKVNDWEENVIQSNSWKM